ncbi:FAD-dependent oxidoreductase [Streptomyces sp. NBC_00984]|uniref:FAD-dependent oxidoreductase n=1 Tax=Streptomyces sp. NBC_00984 TaxID=2903700 RepID=UPI00386B8E43|nr:FAD-dependent oxidoreductase [Streptomyces sp. NBC_00984]
MRRRACRCGNPYAVVAGRCIGSDQAANSALRVQATAMATGQAAGALAAMAADRGTDVTAVPMTDLHRVLVHSGTIVPRSPRDRLGAGPGRAAEPSGAPAAGGVMPQRAEPSVCR